MTLFSSRRFWLSFIALLLSLEGCGPIKKSLPVKSAITTDQAQSFQLSLKIGQSVRLIDGRVLTFSAVTEDSRCPKDAVCVWQGRVEIELIVGDALKDSESVRLGLGEGLTSIQELGSHTLSLVEVLPVPSIKSPSKEGYEIKLDITLATDSAFYMHEFDGMRLIATGNQDRGQFEIEFMGGAAYLILDQRACQLDSFGNSQNCGASEPAIRRKVSMTLTHRQGGEQIRFGFESFPHLALSVNLSPKPPQFQLLFLNDDGQIIDSQTMRLIEVFQLVD